ncbi:outer membrane protein assembly factor BamB family protein [Nucisporomicrobium flavum]|uniref:outer membrane protein assembly factor BamB family protein n=1 Tax=Nucisporomicrobium flavum TaxID=2785915 RepID=UPI0018F5972C|nr:PQQ-binding-like beta-propeller repeat protein [Nucisporomicrobium flavum]
MASGGPSAKSVALVGVVVVIVLATTGVWNPFPKLWSWITKSDPIAPGVATWQTAIGGSPQSVTITGGAVIVEYRTSVEAYGLTAGVQLWKSDADWAGVAGGDSDAVVVVGRLLTKGYEVLDPATGAVRRKDTAATAVWTYADAILDLRCPSAGECELTAWEPRGSKPMWTVPTPGIGFVLNASNPDLPDTQPIGNNRVDVRVAGPKPLPNLIGLPGDGKVQVIDTAQGRVALTRTPSRDQRVAVVGSRVLTVTGEARDGTCYYGVVAHDPPSGQPVWQRDGLNLRTASSDCKQEKDPAGGSDVVLGVDPVGRPELIAAHDGRDLWHGRKGQEVLAVDNSYALIRSTDERTVSARSFSRGSVAWRRTVNPGASAALTPYAAIIADVKPSRIVALSPRNGGVRVEARTDAKVFAAGPGGLILVSGRDMAYLPYAS